MSKIGKMPITIENGVTVTNVNETVMVKGPKGELAFALPSGIGITITEGRIVVAPTIKNAQSVSALFGLVRAQVANMVKGVDKGFERKLELVGVGYRAQTNGTEITLSLGFAHPVKMKAPQGITFAVAENIITIAGMDKSLVGDIASRIRAVRPPEPYKGKGIKYVGERIRRKAGKAAKAVGGK